MPVRLACFGGLVILATGLKYYPIVAAGALLAVLPWRRTTAWAFGLTVAGALGVLWSERASIGRGMFELPRTIHVFGAQLIWREVASDQPAVAAVAVVLLVLSAVLAWRRGWTSGLAGAARGPEGERLMFAVGACVLVGCFLAGTSYAYRWIFGLWLWPWLWREAAAGRTAARLALGCWLVNLWADGGPRLGREYISHILPARIGMAAAHPAALLDFDGAAGRLAAGGGCHAGARVARATPFRVNEAPR